MVSVMALWLPILLSAVLVFVVSSIIHMVLPYHRSDYAKVPSEDELTATMRRLAIPPGDYVIPHAASGEQRQSEEFKKKLEQGPLAMLTVWQGLNMGASLAQWFVYCVVVAIFAAYVAGQAVAPGGEYLSVFRFAGTTAFLGYALALMQTSIWMRRAWSSTLKSMFDGLIYALLTAGVFGWLWPA
ncbi:MAG TPA: hypothetical protein VMV46_20705 [Thermoanaerobaculia bacterium]|nr:hypothetical protein [Thermoanaerobaculia bacterium]